MLINTFFLSTIIDYYLYITIFAFTIIIVVVFLEMYDYYQCYFVFLAQDTNAMCTVAYIGLSCN